ncbi:Fe2+ or Zn2+ uptake regulation protein [Anaerosolibacter carboniphilus]|uniref:Fe2+ or Zn2+ uptake regulation protein n=2 Tax=Anaerosolibacter carboniphilus TaxID=1417629 RepID=A0A841L372_9FIRM|nr:Fe2+ or Zn2+ uptake regulation protein [Anaerosolibacter carboniphilus]
MMNRTFIEDKLKEHGYKLTNQRKAIIDVLVEHQGHFLSAEEIYSKSKDKYAQTNFSTIYRNLEILVNTHIIHKTQIKDGTFSYELVCSEAHHHHLICKGCGKTENIDFCPIEDLQKKLGSKNFTLTDHKFELYGYCQKCQEDQ